jgi:hypothetical protein
MDVDGGALTISSERERGVGVSSALNIVAAVLSLCSAFGLALLVTERHERVLGGDHFVRPPSHVRVVRNEEDSSIRGLTDAA